jgi:tight adherence protein B
VTTALVLALALIGGVPAVVVAVVAVAAWWPQGFLAGVAAWTVAARRRTRRREPGPADEADFLRGIAAELAAGASLRTAVVAAADRAPALDLRRAVRLARAGFAADRIGEELRSSLPYNGRAAAAAFRLAAETGGATAGVMATLAARADEIGALARERRALTAQARLSAWMVGGAPLLLLAALGLTGRLDGLVGSVPGQAVLVVGLGLELAGIGAVALMLRRAQR